MFMIAKVFKYDFEYVLLLLFHKLGALYKINDL